MDENPYRSPEAPLTAEAVGAVSGSREDLRRVARYQRGLLLSILVYLIAAIAWRFATNDLTYYVATTIGLVAALSGLVFAIMLTTKVYDSVPTIVMLVILMMVPFLGLIGLLIVNQKATSVLRRNRIKVGFLGANPSSI